MSTTITTGTSDTSPPDRAVDRAVGDVDRMLGKLRELRAHYAESEAQLMEIDRRRLHLQDGLLRLSGAIQVLEELIAESEIFGATGDDGDTLGHRG